MINYKTLNPTRLADTVNREHKHDNKYKINSEIKNLDLQNVECITIVTK